MMLVLPVQSFASAAMLGCVFSYQGQSTFQHMEQQAMSGEALATCHEPKETDKAPNSNNCKHCTVCHAASTLMIPAVDAAPIVPFAHRVAPHADDTFIGFIPDSPERPPRLAFA
ncbi:MAG: hypothetical protein Q8K52_05625 [Thiobacillus sp.]|nr:hypothetical protein [Thiobacillus sp.]